MINIAFKWYFFFFFTFYDKYSFQMISLLLLYILWFCTLRFSMYTQRTGCPTKHGSSKMNWMSSLNSELYDWGMGLYDWGWGIVQLRFESCTTEVGELYNWGWRAVQLRLGSCTIEVGELYNWGWGAVQLRFGSFMIVVGELYDWGWEAVQLRLGSCTIEVGEQYNWGWGAVRLRLSGWGCMIETLQSFNNTNDTGKVPSSISPFIGWTLITNGLGYRSWFWFSGAGPTSSWWKHTTCLILFSSGFMKGAVNSCSSASWWANPTSGTKK